MIQFSMSPCKWRELKRKSRRMQLSAHRLSSEAFSGGPEAVAFGPEAVRTTTILDYIVRTDTIQPGDDFAQRKLADGLVRMLLV